MGKINLKLGNIKDYRVRSTTLDFRLSLSVVMMTFASVKFAEYPSTCSPLLPYNKKENGSS